jgi:hypothetical protein
MDKQAKPSGLYRFGEVLEKLMQPRGVDAAELAERMRELAGAPAITEEDINALMTAYPGEEFRRGANNLEDTAPREN